MHIKSCLLVAYFRLVFIVILDSNMWCSIKVKNKCSVMSLLQSSLGLNDHHQSAVVNYMRFARYQRGLRLKSVDGCFDDLKSSR